MPNPLTITTPGDRDIVVTRAFDAPRNLVWLCYSKPELVRRRHGRENRQGRRHQRGTAPRLEQAKHHLPEPCRPSVPGHDVRGIGQGEAGRKPEVVGGNNLITAGTPRPVAQEHQAARSITGCRVGPRGIQEGDDAILLPNI